MSISPFSTGAEMMRALEGREISSVELTRMHIDRIERLDDSINAVVVRDFERAIETARDADTARAEVGWRPWRPLLGLPIGLQAIGPYLEDRTPIRFAELVEEAFGGFVPPPAFVD